MSESHDLKRLLAPNHPRSSMVRRNFLRTMSGLGIGGILSACGYKAAFNPDDARDVYLGSADPVAGIDLDRALYPAPANGALVSRTIAR